MSYAIGDSVADHDDRFTWYGVIIAKAAVERFWVVRWHTPALRSPRAEYEENMRPMCLTFVGPRPL